MHYSFSECPSQRKEKKCQSSITLNEVSYPYLVRQSNNTHSLCQNRVVTLQKMFCSSETDGQCFPWRWGICLQTTQLMSIWMTNSDDCLRQLPCFHSANSIWLPCYLTFVLAWLLVMINTFISRTLSAHDMMDMESACDFYLLLFEKCPGSKNCFSLNSTYLA